MELLEVKTLVEGLAIEVLKYIVISIVTFLVTVVVGYFKLKKLVGEINAKVTAIDDKIEDEFIGELYGESGVLQRVAKIEGILLPKSPSNGSH